MQLLFIGDFLSEVFIGIIMVLDTLIYTLVSSAYKIFMAIASARLLSSDVYTDIAGRIYIVVGVFALFVLSYAILKAIVNPDELSKSSGGGGKMVQRVVIAVIGLAITPVLFNLLYQAQGLFLEQDVLGKIFFRIQNTEDVSVSGAVNASTNPDEEIKNIGGSVAAASIWQAFFQPADGYNASEIMSDTSEYIGKAVGTAVLCGLGIAAGVIFSPFTAGTTLLLTGAALTACGFAVQNDVDTYNELSALSEEEISLEQAYAIVAAGGDFDIFLIFMDNYFDDEIKYMWGVSTICGAFALYAFISFSIDMGVRAAKLAYYQIIAPVPLVMQIMPKFDKTFGEYVKNVTSTFLEVFIRISIVYIVSYVICHLTDLFSSMGALWNNNALNPLERTLALALLILGLILFAKSAPEIITQSLNIPKGNMSLGIGKKLSEGGAYQAASIVGSGGLQAVKNWRDSKDKAGYGKRALSAIAGMGSATARATFGQFVPGPGRKPAKNVHDMLEQMDKATAKATDARLNRADRISDHAAAVLAERAAKEEYDRLTSIGASADEINAAKEALKKARERRRSTTAVGAQLEQLGKKVDAYTVGNIDTSKMDELAKLLDATKDLEGNLENTVGKDDLVKAAQSARDALNSVDLRDMTYQNFLNAKHQQNLNALSQADRERIWNAYCAASGTTGVLSTGDAGLNQLLGLISSGSYDYSRMVAAIGDPTLLSDLPSKNDFVLDVNSAEYKLAQSQLAKAVKDADDELKKAKKDAVARRLAEAASGIENDTSRALNSFFSSQQASIRDNLTADMGNGVTLESYLASNFGTKVTVDGTVDYTQMLKASGSNYRFNITGADTNFTLNGIDFVADPDATAEVTFDHSTGEYTIEYTGTTTGGGTASTRRTFRKDEEKAFKNFIRDAQFSKTTDSAAIDNAGNVKVIKAVTEKLKDTAERSGDALRSSEAYITAHEKARQQKENKGGS